MIGLVVAVTPLPEVLREVCDWLSSGGYTVSYEMIGRPYSACREDYYTKKSISKTSRLLDKLPQKITVYTKFANTTYILRFEKMHLSTQNVDPLG